MSDAEYPPDLRNHPEHDWLTGPTEADTLIDANACRTRLEES